MTVLLVPLLASALVLLPLAAPAQTDAQLLLAFKDSFPNGNEALPGWRLGSDPCSWEEVTCNDKGQVTKLMVWNRFLQGPIPSSGWELPPSLFELTLFGNDNWGPLPGSWVLPSGLTLLNLRMNGLNGTIPAEWALPPSLQTLWLDTNQLSGSLSLDWALPASLLDLGISENRLTGSLPPEWLPEGLQMLTVYDNLLTGSLLDLSAALNPSLCQANLGNNLLNGSLAELLLPEGLTSVNLGWNRLEGGLDPGLVFPSSLQVLWLAGNALTGEIPAGWGGRLPHNVQLWIHLNSLEGSLPSWPHLPDVVVTIQPGNSNLCGDVPSAPQYWYGASRDRRRVDSLASCST